MKKALLCMIMIVLMGGAAACRREEKPPAPEELVDGISLSDSDALTASAEASLSGSVPVATGSPLSAAFSGDFSVSVSAKGEGTGKAWHLSGRVESDLGKKVSSSFEEYVSRNEDGYDFYTKASGMGGGEPAGGWSHSSKKANELFHLKIDAKKMKSLKLKESGRHYIVNGTLPLSTLVDYGKDIGIPGIAGSDMISELPIDMEKMNLDLEMSFGKDKRLESLKAELPREARAEAAKLLGGGTIRQASARLEFDLDSKPEVKVPSDVQAQASASEALGDGSLLSENGISAETSEEFASLFHLDYGRLEDDGRLLVSNMLYYMGDNERIRAACRGWAGLSEPDRNALAAIVKQGYVEAGILAEFGANEGELDALTNAVPFPKIN